MLYIFIIVRLFSNMRITLFVEVQFRSFTTKLYNKKNEIKFLFTKKNERKDKKN